MKNALGFVMVGGLLACSSSTTGAGADQGGGGTAPAEVGCDDITGNYNVKVTRLGGDCPEGGDGTASITIAEEAEGLYVVLPGISGGCKGTLNADSCRFQAQCEIFENGAKVVTYNVDYTFAGKQLSGSLVGAAAAGVLQAEACTSTVKHEGSRL